MNSEKTNMSVTKNLKTKCLKDNNKNVYSFYCYPTAPKY